MKPKLLIYGNRKQPDMVYTFTTLEEKKKAFLELFEYLRNEWKVYHHDDMPESHKKLFDLASNGDGVAAIRLLTCRKTYEYEQWCIEDVPAKGNQIAQPVAIKPYFSEVKEVRTRVDTHYGVSVTLKLPKNKEYTFLVVPFMVEGDAWDDLNAASHFIADALTTEWQGEMHNAEGLKKALDVLNEMRHALHYARNPETAPPRITPEKLLNRVMESAESVIRDYSHTPIEELVTAKRRPTSLEEANNDLAEAKRAIESLVYYMKKAGLREELRDVSQTYKRLIPEK